MSSIRSILLRQVRPPRASGPCIRSPVRISRFFSSSPALMRTTIPATNKHLENNVVEISTDYAARRESLLLYRQLLKAAKHLRRADDQCGAMVEWYVVRAFARHKGELSSRRRLQHIRQGRKNLRLLKRAQCYDQDSKAMEKVIAYSYGTRGKLSHILKRRIAEVKSRRNIEPPKRMSGQISTLPPEVVPLLQYCEAKALKIVMGSTEINGEQPVGTSLHGVHLDDYIRAKLRWWETHGGNGARLGETSVGSRLHSTVTRKMRLYERALGMKPNILDFDIPPVDPVDLIVKQLERIPLTVDDFFSKGDGSDCDTLDAAPTTV